MSFADLAAAERSGVCDLMLELGPHAPTLNEGWEVIDLAAHLVVREHDLWAAGGIVVDPLQPVLDLAMKRRRRQGLERLVAIVRQGPPFLFRLMPDGAHLHEYFIHHEDVRRANGGAPRTDRRELDEALAVLVRSAARRRLRKVDAGVDLTWNGGVLYRHGSEPRANIEGAPGELLLYLTGRNRAARVEISGDASAVGALKAADLAI